MILLLFALVLTVVLLWYVHTLEYPHIDDVLADLDREDEMREVESKTRYWKSEPGSRRLIEIEPPEKNVSNVAG